MSSSVSTPPGLIAPDALRRLDRAILRDLVQLVAASEFPEVRAPQANLLANVGSGGIRMSELAERMQLTRGAVSQLVASLEAAGLLERTPHPTDGRGVLVRPTARGLSGYALVFDHLRTRHAQWEALVGPARWQTFREVLGEITAYEESQEASSS